MKLLTFIGLCLVIHLALAQAGKNKLPPLRPQKDDKIDEMFKDAEKTIIHKREAFLPGKEKIPPFRPVKDDKVEETFGDREKRGVFVKVPPIVSEEGDKVNGKFAEHLDKKREVLVEDGQQGNDLPLLMKTLRLRPGSDNKIIDDYINSQKGDNNVEEPRLLGEPLIGKNRHSEPLLPNHGVKKREAREDDGFRRPGEKLIGKYRHPKFDEGETVGNVRDEQKSNDLPLLMKTLRLRPGSDNKIIDDYVNSHKTDENSVEEPRLLGEPLIGKNRHPKHDKKVEDETVGNVRQPGDEESDLVKHGMPILADRYDRIAGAHKKHNKRQASNDNAIH
jgi:hypothetical protein